MSDFLIEANRENVTCLCELLGLLFLAFDDDIEIWAKMEHLDQHPNHWDGVVPVDESSNVHLGFMESRVMEELSIACRYKNRIRVATRCGRGDVRLSCGRDIVKVRRETEVEVYVSNTLLTNSQIQNGELEPGPGETKMSVGDVHDGEDASGDGIQAVEAIPGMIQLPGNDQYQ